MVAAPLGRIISLFSPTELGDHAHSALQSGWLRISESPVRAGFK
jgi:hypothetical protein